MARRRTDQTAQPAPLVLGNESETYADAAPPVSRADYVQSILRQQILSGRIPPGTPIPQDEVAAQLGVSITPVREALRRLQSLGLVQYETHFGATVAELSRSDVQELYLLRAEVEGLAARLAAANMTADELDDLRHVHQQCLAAADADDVSAMAEGSRRFHRAVATAGGRTIIARHLQQIWESHPVPVSHSVWARPPVARHALDCHQEIIDALSHRNAQEAERLMVDHVQVAIAERIEATTKVAESDGTRIG